jgi:protein-S-isoprenylcysteine O-methyltransferase Ste14
MAGSQAEAPLLIRRMAAFNAHLSQDFLGGPRFLKFAWVVNFQKGGTFAWVLLLMTLYGRWTTDAWVYLALHGTYGVLWLLKDLTFPDPNWQKRVTLAGGLMSFLLVLGPYWSFAWLLISDEARVPAPGWRLCLAVAAHTLGVCIMMGADAQKYFTLQVKRGLIEHGFFRHVRHPNYTGEILLYGAYAVLVGHWIPWVILGWVWLGVFVPNMLMKEASMARYPSWAAYKARTGMLLPRLRSPPVPPA